MLQNQQIRSGRCEAFLWAAPSAELVDQALAAARDLWANRSDSPAVRVCVDSIPVRHAGRGAALPIGGFVTAQLAARRLTEISRFSRDTVVFDEAHQAVARTFRAVVETALKGRA